MTSKDMRFKFRYMKDNGQILDLNKYVDDGEEARDEVIYWCKLNNIKTGSCVIEKYISGKWQEYDGFTVNA